VLDAGTHTLSVTFTPTDTSTYNNATASVTITVNASAPPPSPSTSTRFIYEIYNAQQVQGFSFDESTGAVAAVPGSPYTLPNTTTPGFMTADAGGRFLFVSSQPFQECHGCSLGVNELMGYTIDQSTGALTPIPGMPMYPDSTGAILIRPDGKFLYAMINSEYVVYSVDQTTGALTQTGTVPVPSGSVNAVWQMATIDPEGKFLYFIAQSLSAPAGEGFIGVDVLDASSGNATPASDTPTDLGVTFPLPPTVASKGEVYATGQHPEPGQYGVTAMAVAPNGALTPQPGSPYPIATTPPGGKWFTMLASAADPLGRFVFVSGTPGTGSQQIVTFTVQPDGSLVQSASTTGCATAAIDTTGNYLFNTGQTEPHVFRINSSDGSLSPVNSLPENECGGSANLGGQIVAVP
jgi:6-phosphogluconolactonase